MPKPRGKSPGKKPEVPPEDVFAVAWEHDTIDNMSLYCVVREPYLGLDNVEIRIGALEQGTKLTSNMEKAKKHIEDETNTVPTFFNQISALIKEHVKRYQEAVARENSEALQALSGHDDNGKGNPANALGSVEVIADEEMISKDGKWPGRNPLIVVDEAKRDLQRMAFEPTAEEMPMRTFIPKGALLPLTLAKTLTQAKDTNDIMSLFITNYMELAHSVDGRWAKLMIDLAEQKSKQEMADKVKEW